MVNTRVSTVPLPNAKLRYDENSQTLLYRSSNASPALPLLALASLVKKETLLRATVRALCAFRELAYPDLAVANARGHVALAMSGSEGADSASRRAWERGAIVPARRDSQRQGVARDPGLEPL
ncbi:hypothetical protein MRX96_024961 [Rhipicephalus microplus]